MTLNFDRQKAETKDCQGLADGYYQDVDSGCRSYFYCSSGLKAVYVCSGKAVYDGEHCVDPESYRCPVEASSSSNDCRASAESSGGYYQADIQSGCRSYYFCSGDGHKLITLTCSDGRLFNGKRCVDPAQHVCGSTSLPVEDQPLPDSYYVYAKDDQGI